VAAMSAMASALSFRVAVSAPAMAKAGFGARARPVAAPFQVNAFFGKKDAGPKKKEVKKAKVKPMYAAGKPAKPAEKKSPFSFGASKPAAKKPVKKMSGGTVIFKRADKPAAKKPAAAAKPLFSFGSSAAAKKPAAAAKKPLVKKKPMFAKKATGTVKKAAPAKKAIAPKLPPSKRAAPPPAAAKSVPKVSVKVDPEKAADFTLVAIFAGGFLATLALLPSVVEVGLQTIGTGYTLYFAYRYFLFQESRDEFADKLEDLEESTGIDLAKVASATGGLVAGASKAVTEASAASAAIAKAKAAEAAAAADEAEPAKMFSADMIAEALEAEEKKSEETEA